MRKNFTSDDISVDINTATQMFLEGKAAMFHGYPALMQEFQEQMDAELTRIPFFSQISDEAFINMTPSLNIAFNKDLAKINGKEIYELAEKYLAESDEKLYITNKYELPIASGMKIIVRQLGNTTLSSAWTVAMANGQQPSAPEDYIEVEK